MTRRERSDLIRSLGTEDSALAPSLGFCLEGIPEDRLAVHGGPNRNAGLLFNTGRRTVSADDDTAGRFRKLMPSAAAGAANDGLPLFFVSAPEGRRIEEITEEYGGDPFAAFDGVLGRTAREIGAESPLFGTVRIAMAGIYGGRWFSSPFAAYDTDPALHSLMWGDGAEYERAKRDPAACISAPELRLTNRPFFITTLFGYDGRELTPPFFPHIRNQDGVWAFLTRCCYPDSPVGHLPFAVEHDRAVHKPFSDKDFSDFFADAGTVIMLLLHFFFRNLRAESPTAVLAGLGKGLMSCSGLSKQDWRRFVTALHLAGEGKKMERLEARLAASGGKPEYWAADVERHLETLKRASLSCEPYLPREFLSCGKDAERVFRDYLARCGELLSAWPEIWKRAPGFTDETVD